MANQPGVMGALHNMALNAATGMMGGMQQPVVVATDPRMKCYFEECPYQGNNTCIWQNTSCCFGSGGCGKRYCPLHSFEKPMKQLGSDNREACVECGPHYIKSAAKASCKCTIIGLVVFFILFSTPMWLPAVLISNA